MYIFKEAFKQQRSDKKIFMGFGLKHKEDVSKYYVSPRNEGSGKTYMAQIIGEGVNLLLDLIQEKRAGTDTYSNIWRDPGTSEYAYAEIYPSDKWFDSSVIDGRIGCYGIITEKYSGKASKGAASYALKIKIGCYDKDGNFLHIGKFGGQEYDDEDILSVEKLDNQGYDYKLPIFAVLATQFNDQGPESYLYKPTVEHYVRFCEEFYQSRKNRDYYIEYGDVVNKMDVGEMVNALAPYIIGGADGVPHVDKYEKISVNKFDAGEFLSEYASHIPVLPPELVMDKELKPVANAIKSGDCISFLQHGISGTGKTINCKLICQAIGLPIMETINCSENLDEFVLGKFIPGKNGIEFVESYVTKAIRHGGAVVFEEINYAKPQYLAFLNSLLDDNGFVRLDNNEVVRRHKNFRFFATMNFGYYGTKELNQALYNRFQIIKKVCGIDDGKIKNMLLARIPSCEKYVGKMLKVYHKIAEKITKEELDYVISPRNLEAWARLAAYIGFAEAAESTIIQVAKGDEEMEKTVRKLVDSFVWE